MIFNSARDDGLAIKMSKNSAEITMHFLAEAGITKEALASMG